jgi:hypothetical protein
MNIDLLDQKNFYAILQDHDGWKSGEIVWDIEIQICEELAKIGIDFDIGFDTQMDLDDGDLHEFIDYYFEHWDGDIMSLRDNHNVDTLIKKMGIENLNRLFLLLNIKDRCWSFIGMHDACTTHPSEEVGSEFRFGALTAARLIEALLRSYDTNVELNTEEIYKFLDSRKKSKNALGKLYEPKQYVQKKAGNLLLMTATNGYNPSINETADYLYKLILNKFGIDGVPELQTVRSWVKEHKPAGHNPKLGNKPAGYKSLFDEL